MKYILVKAAAVLLLAGCGQSAKENPGPEAKQDTAVNTTDHLHLPSFSSNGNLQAVIEIPAGTNHKYEYDKETKQFTVDEREGKKRIVNYLSYPLNYGFIPSTTMEKSKGGDGDPLDVIVIAEGQPTGTVMEVMPIALLVMTDKGEQDHKVLAIPVDASLRTLDIKDYNDLTANHPSVKTIIETWFANYDPADPKQMQGWKDEKAALEEVKKWKLE